MQLKPLPLPQSLLRLDLRSNGVGLLGCKALSGLLKERNSSLAALGMAGNAADTLVLEVGPRIMLLSSSAGSPLAYFFFIIT